MNHISKAAFVCLVAIFSSTSGLPRLAEIFTFPDARASSTEAITVPSSNVEPGDYNRCLMERINRNDLSGAREMIEKGADVNQAQDSYGYTALGLSALLGQTELVKLLIQFGANPDLGHRSGDSPLSYAATHGHSDIVKYLLENGANPNHADSLGFTPLIAASRNGQVEAVIELLNAGADPHAKSKKYGLTALHLASREGFHEIVKILLDRGGCQNEIPSALTKAIQNEHTQTAEILLTEFNSSPNLLQGSHSLLYWPFFNLLIQPQRGLNEKMVDTLLRRGATFKSHFEIKELIERAKQEIFEKIPLHQNGKPTLCMNGGCSELFLAAWDGDTRTVNALLQKGETFLSQLEIVTLIIGGSQAQLDAERRSQACGLRFEVFRKFLYENSFGRGVVDPESLNKLASGTILNLDERMILSIGLGTLKEHCDDERTRQAIEIIHNQINSPFLESVQKSLRILHEWLYNKEMGAGSSYLIHFD